MKDKIISINNYLSQYPKTGIAYSGGIDSTLLLTLAHKTNPQGIIAYIVRTAFVKETQIEEAVKYCQLIKVAYQIIEYDVFQEKELLTNPKNRCYICKKAILTAILTRMKQDLIPILMDGTNADDSKSYRPGKQALEETGILSPLAIHGFTKNEIRQLAKDLNIKFYDKPADTCLATRIPYEQNITKEKLQQIEAAEKILAQAGLKIYRVRHHGNIARIEIQKKEMPDFLNDTEQLNLINKKIKVMGFQFCTLDLGGYQSGVYD
ncbi:MAG: ATP-dependent sacrificial sulfur transferase LarE [Spirochaetes bacterium]|nr:ATP-dependent sacrificial sulfur transferase LarE [Spirochaetota bacterium]